MEHRRTASAEFPNDNPELHDGALWVVSRPCAPARLLLRAVSPSERPSEPLEAEFEVPEEDDDGVLDIDIDVELLEEPPPVQEEPASAALKPVVTEPAITAAVVDESVIEVPVSKSAESTDDAFAVFVSALVRVAMNAGATRIAGELPAFLEQGKLASDKLSPEVVEALTSRGFAEARPGGLTASADCAATCAAWRRVLSGQSDDLSACGTSTLDGWAAELLAAALGAPPDAVKKLRRELRRLGVAAFGIIAQAA